MTLEERARYSNARIGELRDRVAAIPQLSEKDLGVCIYVTGSYARLEAGENSDLDLFFVKSESEPKLSRLDKILIDAELIKITRAMGFGEFSGDGQYLEVHDLDQVLRELGSPKDDFYNHFTARLLLLLESSAVFADGLYEVAIDKIILSYYRDYEDHTQNFRPVFLINDIVRFWKTMCLNYEQGRNVDSDLSAADLELRRGKARLKNLKLKFSRMLTCFSLVLLLAQNRDLTRKKLAELVHLPPLERLRRAAQEAKEQTLLDELLGNYEWFLDFNNRPKPEVLASLNDPGQRQGAFARATQFGDNMYKLLTAIAGSGDTIRYLLL
jgi:predicted nucleotidyltransferase